MNQNTRIALSFLGCQVAFNEGNISKSISNQMKSNRIMNRSNQLD
jgi:hypothetical protein